MNGLKRLDTPALVFGIFLFATGVYYVLRNTFGLPLDEIDWDRLWPFIVVCLGAAVLFKVAAHPAEA